MTYMKRALAHSDPRFAEILRRLGHAEEAVETERPAEEERKAPKAKKKATKRAYKRRDMQAEEE